MNRCPLEDLVISDALMGALMGVVYQEVLDDQNYKEDVDQEIGRTGEAARLPNYGYLDGHTYCDMNDYLNEDGEFCENLEEKSEEIKMENKEGEMGDLTSAKAFSHESNGAKALPSVSGAEDIVDDTRKKDVDGVKKDEKNQEGKSKKQKKGSEESTKKLMRSLSQAASRAFASLSSNASTADCIQYLLTQHIRTESDIDEIYPSDSKAPPTVVDSFNIPRDFLYRLLEKAAITTKSAGISDIPIVEESLVMKLIERRKIIYQIKLKKNSIINNLKLAKVKGNPESQKKGDDGKDSVPPTSPSPPPSSLEDKEKEEEKRSALSGRNGDEKIDDKLRIDSPSLVAVNAAAAQGTIAQVRQLQLDLLRMSAVHNDEDSANVFHDEDFPPIAPTPLQSHPTPTSTSMSDSSQYQTPLDSPPLLASPTPTLDPSPSTLNSHSLGPLQRGRGNTEVFACRFFYTFVKSEIFYGHHRY